uniref:Uncharacterized protein n=1 Tax=Chromera velia CCMP2878 TaxID=1169474 RepID=A0A0G4GMZ5_9ALVE|eukprot:Cvel_4945.t1-p1 / transcript=Cvel_4945.t1 / gene=Cvel_4945 / organism=Chromera_velia_CCMP2878 / gene_product=P2X purinoceptor 5, putative / transcript_product=P2X purinoceptor 5, putative / location=Cvel_scaffold223:91008-97331(-) / protein_length=368 / sequence_SO=supercontig / SO=protein_coding / is_pseudo=false
MNGSNGRGGRSRQRWGNANNSGWVSNWCSYRAKRYLRVRNKHLGALYWSCMLIVLTYIVVNVFIIDRGYLQVEYAPGFLLSDLMGPTRTDKGMPLDLFDTATNPGEVGAIFFPTRLLVTKKQAYGGRCSQPTMPCEADDDCSQEGDGAGDKGTCGDDKRCVAVGWCPAEDPSGDATEVHVVEASKFKVWLKSKIYFSLLSTADPSNPLDVSTMEEEKPVDYPQENQNSFRLTDLLRFANTKLEDVQENGALVMASVFFKCDLDMNECEPDVSAKLVDSESGFNVVTNHYYTNDDGTEFRDTTRWFGVRMIAQTAAEGSKISWGNLALQIASAVALLGVTVVIADLYMAFFTSEKLHYMTAKDKATHEF